MQSEAASASSPLGQSTLGLKTGIYFSTISPHHILAILLGEFWQTRTFFLVERE
jgi:hypothetical protein